METLTCSGLAVANRYTSLFSADNKEQANKTAAADYKQHENIIQLETASAQSVCLCLKSFDSLVAED